MLLKLFYVNTSSAAHCNTGYCIKKKKSVKAIGYDLDQSGGLQLALIMSQLGVFDSILLFSISDRSFPFSKVTWEEKKGGFGREACQKCG